MGKYNVRISEKADRDWKKIYKSGKKIDIQKIETFLVELAENPRIGTGNPEQLKHKSSEIWSRKINKKDRLVYKIEDSQVIVLVLSALGHYSDK